ncbi:MAG: VirB8/TrbF family protein [Sphingomonas sp.]|jgi:type IV secretion system protein VirB8
MTDQPRVDSDATPRTSYYALAESWAADRRDGLRRSRTIAWTVAGIAIGIAALEAVALAALAPLKTVVPYTLLVDRNTGFAQALKGTEIDQIAPDAALTQSLLAQYVVARESFDISSISSQYRKVALWSADTARRRYLALIPPSNPESPLSRLPRTSVVVTTIRSVSPLSANTALVRFETRRIDQGQEAGASTASVAIISYRFARLPWSIEDRLVNPLGFQVTKYRVDQEAPPAVAPTTASVVTPAISSSAP